MLKNMRRWGVQGSLIALMLVAGSFAELAAAATPSIGVVSFRKCAEESKLGKNEQATFEEMKGRMEKFLQEKEEVLNDISKKLNDQDYLDGITKDAENELRHKQRALGQEMGQAQNQFLQMLQQANMRIIQSISEEVTKNASEIAESKKLDLVLNDEGALYFKPTFDITDAVIKKMDEKFEKEAKTAK